MVQHEYPTVQSPKGNSQCGRRASTIVKAAVQGHPPSCLSPAKGDTLLKLLELRRRISAHRTGDNRGVDRTDRDASNPIDFVAGSPTSGFEGLVSTDLVAANRLPPHVAHATPGLYA